MPDSCISPQFTALLLDAMEETAREADASEHGSAEQRDSVLNAIQDLRGASTAMRAAREEGLVFIHRDDSDQYREILDLLNLDEGGDAVSEVRRLLALAGMHSQPGHLPPSFAN